jgi:hypothetical protein
VRCVSWTAPDFPHRSRPVSLESSGVVAPGVVATLCSPPP